MSVAVVQQYIIPSVVNSLVPFAAMDLTLATERLLKVKIKIINWMGGGRGYWPYRSATYKFAQAVAKTSVNLTIC